MANDIESQNSINSLKASFCRQHFQDLLQFLRDFDISQTEGQAANNSLNMNFLLCAYDHNDKITKEKQNKEKDEDYKKRVEDAIQESKSLKGACKWRFNDIEERDVLIAVNEYFDIVSTRLDVNNTTNILLKNINTKIKAKELFPIFIDNKQKEFCTFEDNTTKTILNYFGISTQDTTLGKQRNAFAQFILDTFDKSFYVKDEAGNLTNNMVQGSKRIFPQEVYDSIPEAQFINAFQLLAETRNWSEHNHSFLQKSEYAFLLYKFIIFTHIGIVYFCRRLWNNETSRKNLKDKTNEKNGKKKYIIPRDYDNDEIVYLKVKIECNKKEDNISGCEWLVDGKKEEIGNNSQGEVIFTKEIKRYQQFQINYEYNGKPQPPFIGKINYYPLNPAFLNIIVRPPHEPEGLLDGIAGDDEEIEVRLSNIVAKSIEDSSRDTQEKLNESLKKLGELEPSIMELQGLLGKVDKDSEDRKKIIHDTIIPQLKGIDQDLNDIKTGVNKTYELLKNNSKVLGSLFLFSGAGFFIYSIINNRFTLLQFPTVLSLILSIAVLLFIIAFIYITKQQSPFKFLKGKTPKAKLSYCFIYTVLFAAIVGFLGYGIKEGRNLYLKSYNFAEHEMETNQELVELMESVLKTNPKNDEDLRIQLTKFYIDYANDTQKALLVANPMLNNIEKYKNGILTLAEALYSQGKDYWKVKDLLYLYKKAVDSNSPVVNRINGILTTWGQGQESNVDSGMNLLKKAADEGDAEAQYYYGYALSHEMTDWGKFTKEKIIHFSEYNLADAIVYFRKALPKPKAALELGKLYSDLNMKDSAKVYFEYVLQRSTGTLYYETLYRLGLLHKFNDKSEQSMIKAAILGYEPAILYRAKKEKDYKTIIDIYKSLNGYLGYRYLLPITFGYISLGQKSKALHALQNERPFGKFNEEFVIGMEAMLGSQYMKKDSIAGMEFMKKSAVKGCLYAEMICLYREAEHSGMTNAILLRMQEIGEEIPYAYVLLSHLAWKENSYNSFEIANSEILAREAICRGHVAGKLFLAVPKKYKNYLFCERLDTVQLIYHMQSRQMALRMKCDVLANIYYGYKAFKALSKRISCTDNEEQFWHDVSKANNIDLSMDYYTDSKIVDIITDETLLKEFGDEIIDNILDNPFN